MHTDKTTKQNKSLMNSHPTMKATSYYNLQKFFFLAIYSLFISWFVTSISIFFFSFVPGVIVRLFQVWWGRSSFLFYSVTLMMRG